MIFTLTDSLIFTVILTDLILMLLFTKLSEISEYNPWALFEKFPCYNIDLGLCSEISGNHHTIIRAAFVCLSVCLFVPYLLRGPLTDLRQTWWVYVGGPRNCPWGVLFRKGQRLDGSTGHFHFPLYYICTSLMPHAATAPLACSCRV